MNATTATGGKHYALCKWQPLKQILLTQWEVKSEPKIYLLFRMIKAILVFNNHGKPRVNKFYQYYVSFDKFSCSRCNLDIDGTNYVLRFVNLERNRFLTHMYVDTFLHFHILRVFYHDMYFIMLFLKTLYYNRLTTIFLKAFSDLFLLIYLRVGLGLCSIMSSWPQVLYSDEWRTK